MKAIISDVNILNQLQPQQLEIYLKAKGWREHSRIPEKVSIWIRDTYSEDKLKIQLPIDNNFDDYALRISEILEILERAENRSQIDILGELIANYPNLTIQGVVTQIMTPPNSDILSGKITLLGIVFDKMQEIKVELANHEYVTAIKAYQERLAVACTGDLMKENNVFVLKNPRKFQIENI
ncbi:hypothetical protein [Brunnivagina elsteri]|uniref:Uncharacterized protein n=1 Tax=Brunnivagina elsteri CCALA 953 TaxID=987040 RepID=A0A2A2TKJ1_9CYAN|nr:hypothetical protein [Calothrix elsteri]PAX56986.1 hypothetical protein CK510_09805 [Calothrix elsteri CCALA 953]